MAITINGQRKFKMENFNLNSRSIRILILILAEMILITFFVLSARAWAADVGLTWDAIEPPVDGYRLYQRTEGEQYDYSNPVWQGPETKALIQNLSPATQYYFVVRAYLADDASGDSNEVGYRPALQAPGNLRIDIEISVFINVDGKPIVSAEQSVK